jgi:hypothetical protein
MMLLTRRNSIRPLANQSDCSVRRPPQLVNQLAVPSRNTKRDFLDSVRHFDAHAVHIKFVVREWVAIHVHA